MKIEIKVPQAGESVTEAMISEWYKKDGDFVKKDEMIGEFETDKANMEFAAEADGRLKIDVDEGEVVAVGQVIGSIDTDAKGDGGEAKAEEPAAAKSEEPSPESKPPTAAPDTATAESADQSKKDALSPAVRRVVNEEKLDPAQIQGSGKEGRILKGDALKAAASRQEAPPVKTEAKPEPKAAPIPPKAPAGSRESRTVPMSMMRRRIAQRLVEAQQNAALLTTFNEIDMSAVMALRSRYKEAFEKKHGVRLGFMSFFVKACVEALQYIPEINARVEDNQIIYNDYQDIGVAVGTKKGLVVPVLRNAEAMSLAAIENGINAYAAQAREGKISLDDLAGGTFTISNGGIYGSLLSTPILNPPQSGILGMHKIEKRPVVVNDEVVVRPMMYVALTYDHRIVDGKGAVSFLVKVKECLEDPSRMLLEI